jgi:hypothetical protein
MKTKILLLVALVFISAINAQSLTPNVLPPMTSMEGASGNYFETKNICLHRHEAILSKLSDAEKKVYNMIKQKNPAVKAKALKTMAIIKARTLRLRKSMKQCTDKQKFCTAKPPPIKCVSTKNKCVTMSGGKCVRLFHTCAPEFVNHFCSCRPRCKSPFKWDIKTRKCVKPSPVCKPPFVSNGTICIRINIICPKDHKKKGKICVPITPKCKDGCKLVGKRCECPLKCPKDFKPVNNVCVKIIKVCPEGQEKNKKGECETPVECIKPLKKVGNSCQTIIVKPICKADEKLVKGKCKKIVVCPRYFIFNKLSKKCVRIDIICPIGEHLNRKTKKCERVEKCPKKFKFNKKTNACEIIIEICKKG